MTLLGISLVARQRAIATLRDVDPALYQTAASELSPVRVLSSRRKLGPDTVRRHRALRRWVFAHDAAVSGIVIFVGSYILVWLDY
ncbi:MAG: hypothetical protein OEN23_03955 [Paracoccaceae bacterium]|nr:hypothetical protein [Paracoccaceae bacterium]